MLRPYLDLLTVPGGRLFSAAAFVARMPMAMVGLGIVLLVVAETGRYGMAGALSATFALVNAGSAPVIARLVDRLGQRRVIWPAVLLHAVAVCGFVALVSADAPVGAMYAAVAVAGLFSPSVGSLVRARWGHVLGADPRLHTAYAFEAVLDELIFVLGPLLATVLATKVAPQAGLLAAVVLLVPGSAALLAHRRSEPPPARGHDEGHPSALRSGLPALLLVMPFIGGVFGSVEISAVAFADASGRPGMAGVLLACYAAGSMVAGLLFGAVQWRVSARARLATGTLVMTATATTLPWADHIGVLAGCLFVAGVGIAPTLISAFSLVERLVPVGTVTEGLSWATTGLVVGLSAGTWLSGRLVDTDGVPAAFAVATVCGLAAVVACGMTYRRLPGAAPATAPA